jgi:hypothetical protein
MLHFMYKQIQVLQLRTSSPLYKQYIYVVEHIYKKATITKTWNVPVKQECYILCTKVCPFLPGCILLYGKMWVGKRGTYFV